MSELGKVNYIVEESESINDDAVSLKDINLQNLLKFKTEEMSETAFLEKKDSIIIKGKINPSQEQRMQETLPEPKIYKAAAADLYSYLEQDIVREKNGLLQFSEHALFDDKENILYLDQHIVGVPKGIEMYFYPLFVMVQMQNRRLIMYWEDQKFSIESKDYALSNSSQTNLYIDDKGDIAINYLEGIAIFKFQDRELEVNGYKLNFEDDKQLIKINNNWIEMNSNLQFDAKEGMVRFNYTYVKVPSKSLLFYDHDVLNIVLQNEKKVQLLAQVDRLVFRSDEYWLVFDINSRIILDKKGSIGFVHQDSIAILKEDEGLIKVADMLVCIAKGAIVRVTKDYIHLSELIKINPKDRLVTVAKSKFFFSGKVEITQDKAGAKFRVNNKQIRVMPYKKQLFINIGGKLIVVTVSVGIAVDGNGNIAFDYQGSLTTLDTEYFVMNLGGSIFSFGSIEDCCCEFLGTQVAVGSQKQNVLELLKGMLAEDFQGLSGDYNLEEVIEMLLSTDVSSFLNSTDFINSGVDMSVLMELVKGRMMGRITGDGESYFALMNKENLNQLIMGDQQFDIQQGNNFYVPVNMDFLKGMLKFKDNKVYFVS